MGMSRALSGNGAPVTIGRNRTTVDAALLARPRPNFNFRPPSANDDSLSGFAVGSYWLAFGRVWVCMRAAVGVASWVLQPISPLPVDAVPGAAIAFGTRVLRRAWSTAAAPGKACTITRTTDSATFDVFFLPDGRMDVAGGDAFCAGLTPQQCIVTTLYDQSGNGNHATATTAYGPLWSALSSVGGVRAISFASVPNTTGDVTNVARYMVVPTTFSWVLGTSTWFVASQQLNTTANRTIFETTGHVGLMSNFFGSSVALSLKGMGATVPLACDTAPSLLTLQMNGFTATVRQNNKTASAGNGGSSGTNTGANIGSDQIGAPACMDLAALVAYTSALPAASVQAFQTAAHQLFDIAPQSMGVFCQDGDSSNSGAGSADCNSITKQAAAAIGLPLRVYNAAVFGVTLSSVLSRIAGTMAACYDASAPVFVYSILAGPNDIRGGDSAATVYGNLKALVAAVKAFGPNVRVIVWSPWYQGDIVGTGGAKLAAVTAYIAMVRAGFADGSLGADALYDLAADTLIGGNATAAALSNTVYGTSDLQHPRNLAMAIAGGGIAAVASPLLAA